MRRVAVIGSGPASAGVCLALKDLPVNVHVFDVGEVLDEPYNSSMKKLADRKPNEWDSADIKRVTHNPSLSLFKTPQKRFIGLKLIKTSTNIKTRFRVKTIKISKNTSALET